MRYKKVLATVLLAVSFCFVSGVGYGELIEKEYLLGTQARPIESQFVESIINYIMMYPDSFLRVSHYYDEIGRWAEYFPAGVKTKDKIVVFILDSRDIFSGKTGTTLLLELKLQGFRACYFLGAIVSDMDNDIVVKFMDNLGEPLGYFYQGEYHLWDEAVSKEAMRTDESVKETERVPTSLEFSGQIYTGTTKGHWVSEKIDEGRIIKLEDGSLWEISPLDRIETMLWLVTDDISVIGSANPFYPYYLLHKSTGEPIEAKLISL